MIDADHTVFCPGHMTLGNHRFHCWKRGGHGRLDMIDALEQSCDVYFYEISRKVGIDKIAAMATRLGLGEKLGVDLPGARGGVIQSTEWKRAPPDEPWQAGTRDVEGKKVSGGVDLGGGGLIQKTKK